MAKKQRAGNREPRKPKQPKTDKALGSSLADVMKSRAGANLGAK